MTAYLAQAFNTQFFDGATVADGYSLYTYDSGTTTPKTVYKNQAGTVAHTNPIVLDADGMPPGGTIWITSGEVTFALKDLLGATVWTRDDIAGSSSSGDVSAFRTDLADDSDPAKGAALLGYKGRTVYDRLDDVASLLDFGADPTGVADSTAAVQAWVDACSSDAGYGAPRGHAPAGKYKLTAPIIFSKIYCNIRGDGMFQTQFACDGVTGSVFKAAAITYFKPCWSDFSISDGTRTTTGVGIDFSAVTSDVYGGSLERIAVTVKGHGVYAERFFSMKMDTVLAASSAGHSFLVSCGPGVFWVNCYAVQAGPGKAGYRLAGGINMQSCNGADSAEHWAVFGQDPSTADGFEADFSSFTYNYPDISMDGCNVEFFSKCGIRIQSQYKRLEVRGGTIDRSGLSTAYIAAVCLLNSPLVTGTPAYFGFAGVTLGTGVPNGGAALTNAYIYAKGGQPIICDTSGALAQAGISYFYSAALAGTVPTVLFSAIHDIYGDSSFSYSALTARRFSAQVIRYKTPSVLTPVGAGQAIDVTGYTKVIVTPAAAASITTATFTATVGAGADYLRNGDLIIEAGNGNLTVNHSASGPNTFRLAGGANVAMATGQILRFCRSETSSQWIQV